MHSKNDNLETMMNDEVDEDVKELSILSKTDIKVDWTKIKVVSFSSIMFIYCIIKEIK